MSLKRPAILFALMLILVVVLTALWNFVLAHDYGQLRDLAGEATFHTTFIIVGSALFLAIIVMATILGFELFARLRWSQRQASFIASVSHELNSPLSAIKLFAQTLQNDTLEAKDRARFVRKILIDADRLSHLVANILRAQDADRRSDELAIDPVVVDLRKYLEEYLDNARAVHSEEANLVLSGERAPVAIDPLVFRQVLDNLVDNSIRYCGTKPASIEFRILPDGAWTELQVIDQGVGIESARLESIFERFFRIEGGRRETGRQGMGIGLNIVRSIVRSHGGSVSACSDGIGKGATIRVRLPAAVPAGRTA